MFYYTTKHTKPRLKYMSAKHPSTTNLDLREYSLVILGDYTDKLAAGNLDWSRQIPFELPDESPTPAKIGTVSSTRSHFNEYLLRNVFGGSPGGEISIGHELAIHRCINSDTSNKQWRIRYSGYAPTWSFFTYGQSVMTLASWGRPPLFAAKSWVRWCTAALATP